MLLLRPASVGRNLSEPAGERPAPGTGGDGPGVVAATILHLDPQASLDAFARLFESEAQPRIAAAGVDVVGHFVTEDSPNTFPRLPVREGERVWVTLARYPDAAAYGRTRAAFDADPAWRDRVRSQLRPFLVRDPEVLRLKPTARSLLHG